MEGRPVLLSSSSSSSSCHCAAGRAWKAAGGGGGRRLCSLPACPFSASASAWPPGSSRSQVLGQGSPPGWGLEARGGSLARPPACSGAEDGGDSLAEPSRGRRSASSCCSSQRGVCAELALARLHCLIVPAAAAAFCTAGHPSIACSCNCKPAGRPASLHSS